MLAEPSLGAVLTSDVYGAVTRCSELGGHQIFEQFDFGMLGFPKMAAEYSCHEGILAIV